MATPRVTKNVAIAMQSAIAGAKTLTAITKASPGVVSSTSHGYSNGDYVLLEVLGMWQVNNRVFRVSSVAADAFTLEGEDTTDYDAFTSGTAKKITFGTSITTAKTVNNTGGEYELIDTTTIHDNQRTQVPGVLGASATTMSMIWDTSDAGLIAMNAAYKAGAPKAFKWTIGTGGPIWLFYGYCGAALDPELNFGEVVTCPAIVTRFGASTHYSS